MVLVAADITLFMVCTSHESFVFGLVNVCLSLWYLLNMFAAFVRSSTDTTGVDSLGCWCIVRSVLIGRWGVVVPVDDVVVEVVVAVVDVFVSRCSCDCIW